MVNFKLITDTEEAKKIWNSFSLNVEFYDSWDARYIYNQILGFPIHFIVAFENDKAVVCLPLQLNTKTDEYEIFGGRFFSLNKIFAEKEHEQELKEIFSKLDKPLFLRWLKDLLPGIATKEDGKMRLLETKSLNSLEEYFDKYWSGEKKKKIKKYIRQFNEKKPDIFLNRYEDYEKLVELNIKRFGEKSLFFDPKRVEFFKQVISKFDVQLVTVELDNEIVGVAYRVISNNKFYGINTGINPEISNIGKYLYINAIQYAIENKLDSYNALEGDYGWKEAFGFHEIPQYQLDLT